MLRSDFAVYLGTEKKEGFFGFVCENSFFCVLSCDEGLSKDEGRERLKNWSLNIQNRSIENLADFESYLGELIKTANLPAQFSLSCGFLHDSRFFLKTARDGEIYLRRGDSFSRLIDGENSASGYVEPGDFFIFTTRLFTDLFGGEERLRPVFEDVRRPDGKDPQEVLEAVTPKMKEQDDQGTVAVFVRFAQEKVEVDELAFATPKSTSEVEPAFADFFSKARLLFQTQDKKRTYTLVAVAAIFIVFIWSVVLGYQRRTYAQLQKKIRTTKELVEEKLSQAEEVSFLNLPSAIALINDAKQDVANLKKELKDDKNREVARLEGVISQKEGEILKKEEKPYEEFFDLSLENKQAKGTNLYLDGDVLFVLDPQGAVYVLSLTKKSLEKRPSSEIKNASFVVSDKGNIYVFKKKSGVFKVDADGKAKKVIEDDKDWGEIAGGFMFNGNLYLLDRGKGDVYKYLAAQDGFSEKSSYFTSGEKGNLQDVTSLAIDASVYVSTSDTILKYTSGVKEDFAISFPEEQSTLTKILTTKDLEKVYGWDKGKGAIYVVNKQGTYERQIKSAILSKASDFTVFKNNAYILLGGKLYRVSVE